jgi:hypothetical protein
MRRLFNNQLKVWFPGTATSGGRASCSGVSAVTYSSEEPMGIREVGLLDRDRGVHYFLLSHQNGDERTGE